MRQNLPVTQNEMTLSDKYILSSTTDLKGTILTSSDDFVKISGYSRQELIGQPHNILRHPDVPADIFADMWRTLKQGKTWSAVVKNRAKNGDHYWVLANVTPMEKDGQVVGYVSVRTPATSKQIAEAKILYQQVASGKVRLEGAIARSTSSFLWDKLAVKGALNTSLLIYSAIIMLIGASILAFGFYQTQIKPIEQQALEREIEQARSLIENHIQTKAISVSDLAATLSGYNELSEALAGKAPRVLAVDKLSNIREHFARITDYRNIRAQAFQMDKTSFAKSWDPDSYGELFDRPLLNRILQNPKTLGGMSLNMNAMGVGVTGYAPVHFQDQMVGVISVTGGLASVGLELKELGVDWIMLIDEQQSRFNGRLPATLRNNQVFADGLVLANNNWFEPTMISQFQQLMPKPARDETSNAILVEGKVLVELPVYNAIGDHIGRHILMRSAEDIELQIAEATKQGVVTIIAVIMLVFIIIGFLMWIIRQRAIKPLMILSDSMMAMRRSGRFNERVMLIDRGDEISQIVNVYNSFVGNVQEAMSNISDSMTAMSQGRLDVEIKAEFRGDLAVMKEAINLSLTNVRTTVHELSQVMKAMNQGDFSREIDVALEGEFEQILVTTRSSMSNINETINAIVKVMDKMKEGKFQRRVDVEAAGDLLRLKDGVNDSMDALESAMKDITRIVVAQSNGDLTQKITAQYHGELRVLKEAINTTADKLVQVVSQAIHAADVVRHASDEVSQGAGDLSQRVQEQAAALEETSATMDEMNSAVQNNTQNALEASRVAQDVQQKANNGTSVMQQTIDAMNAIQASSHKIVEIVSLIDGIAFQTNLLALNAAVEAARAGDHGRGFAVVASEVRALAQKSAEAAKEIRTLIDESVNRIDQGTQLASESGDVLTGINHSVEQVAQMIQQIAQASKEQAEGVNQVHKAINDIDQVTQQNAALVEETSAAAESMTEQASALSRNMAFFNQDQLESTKRLG